MAIQMRRGLRKDFDPNKMLPGEWAVSIDSSTSNQIVWMCFSTGVCKRMGTYEDFQNMVYQATGEIIERYEENFGQILAEVKEVANDVKSDKEEVIYIKSEITDTYLPQIRQYISSASSSANSASADAVKAKASADAAKASEQNAKKSEEKAKTYADNASAVTGVQIATKEIAGLVKGGDNLIDEDGTLTLTKSTTERTLTNSYAGGIKINEICGASEQYSGTITDEEGNEIAVPIPDYPQEIKSVEVSEVKVVGAQLLKYPFAESTKTMNGVEFTDNGDGSITISGTVEQNVNSEFTLMADWKTTPGVYAKNAPKKANYMINRFIRETGKYDSVVVNARVTTFNTTSWDFDKYIYRPYLQVDTTMGKVNETFYPMINKGDVPLPWEPYQESIIKLSEPITLNGIGDTKDRIARKDGVWGVESNIFNSAMPSNAGMNNISNNRFQVNLTRIEFPKSHDKGFYYNIFMSNKFKSIPLRDSASTTEQNIISGNNEYVYFRVTDDTTDKEMQQVLNSGVEISYIVAEPTFEPLPESDQIALNSLVSFNTVTHISTDSGIEPIIEVEYGTSKVGAYTLDAWNTAKRNEIKNAQIEALITELATNTVAESEE